MVAINFILMCLFWGASFLFVKINIQYFPPIWAAGLRFLTGGICLLLVVLIGRYKLPRTWKEIYPPVVFGLVNGTAYGMLYWATMFVPSSIAALLNGSMPFFTALWAFIMLNERFHPAKIAGLVLGFAGIAIIVSENLVKFDFADQKIIAELVIIGGAVLFGWVTTYARKHSKNLPPLVAVTFQMVATSLILFVFAIPIDGFNKPFDVNSTSVGSLLFLGVFSTAAAFFLYNWLLQRYEAARVAYFNYIVPVIATFLGVLVLHEPFKWLYAYGLVFVFMGLYFMNRKSSGKAVKQEKLEEVVVAQKLDNKSAE